MQEGNRARYDNERDFPGNEQTLESLNSREGMVVKISASLRFSTKMAGPNRTHVEIHHPKDS